MTMVSVIIPTYNGERYLAEAIQSVLAQSYTDVEVIVVDDGSTDRSRDIVSSFGKSVRYVYQNNQGAGVARNRGVEESRGRYIAFLDSDDVWLPTKLEQQIHALEAHAAVGTITADMEYISEDGVREHELLNGRIPESSFSALFLGGFQLLPSVLLLRREAFAASGGFDPGFHAAGWEDLEWGARLMAATQALYCSEVLVLYRRHARRASTEIMLRNERYLLDCLMTRFGSDLGKRRYLLERKVALHSDSGKLKLAEGRVGEGRADLLAAIRLAVQENVSRKMLFRSLCRLVRSYAMYRRPTVTG